MIKSKFKFVFFTFLLFAIIKPVQSAEMVDPIKVNWSFKGLTGTFDRVSSFVRLKGFVVSKTGQDKVLSNR